MRVMDFMRTDPPVVRRDTNIREAIKIFLNSDAELISVVDEENNFVGILRKRDIVWSLLPTFEDEEMQQELISDEYYRLYLVDDIMEWDGETIQEDDSIVKAAALMEKTGLNAIPVLRGEKIVGIITITEILRCVSETSENF